MGGDDAANRQLGDGFEEFSGTVQLVQRIGALQNFIENNEGFQTLASLTACTSLAEFQQFFQSDQFCIEVRDAMRQVVCGSHAGEHSEAGNLQMVGKDRHSSHR